MTLSLADRSNKAQKVKVLPIAGKDPDAQRSEMIKVVSFLSHSPFENYYLCTSITRGIEVNHDLTDLMSNMDEQYAEHQGVISRAADVNTVVFFHL